MRGQYRMTQRRYAYSLYIDLEASEAAELITRHCDLLEEREKERERGECIEIRSIKSVFVRSINLIRARVIEI